ncbi:MAG: sigma 54-interacting transcriptional regulator [Planctomycetes bacterium]|nr:sigma 54-interacting transcriptional regulator [Planctomycetota bacterium]
MGGALRSAKRPSCRLEHGDQRIHNHKPIQWLGSRSRRRWKPRVAHNALIGYFVIPLSKSGHTVVSFLGFQLDRASGADRWQHWRPNVAMCQHGDLLVRRLILLTEPRFSKLFEAVASDIATISPETTVERRDLHIRDAWDFEQVFDALFELTRNLGLDPEAEDVLVHMTTGSHVAQICLFLLTETRHFPARLLQTGPPRQGSDEPGTWQIIDLDLSRFDKIAQRFAQQHQQGQSLLKSGIATRSRAFNELITQVETVAPASTAPILLTGPTGAGKSQLARRIHELKQQRHQLAGPFVEVNCATLRGDHAQSALFGHKRGAFTGALQDRAGLLRTANGGMLFLDEIGELGGDEQAMLLRALEEKRFLPLGSDREVDSDFQLVAGTNKDLGEAVAAGRFREDLLARINLWTFRLPGLQARSEDIEPNVDHELERWSAQVGRRVHFNVPARQRYLAFATSAAAAWRGNFRDLNASITRLCTLAPGGRITEALVDAEIARLTADWQREPTTTGGATEDDEVLRAVIGDDRVAALDRFDRVQLAEVLRTCRRHRSLSAAGRELFAVSRNNRASTNDADRLRKYLLRFGVDPAIALGP